MPWVIRETELFARKFERFKKKNKKTGLSELLLNNLDTYTNALQCGAHPQNINAGFIHHEPGGVKAIDQKGSRKNVSGTPKECRLYVFPDVDNKVLYLITVGDKNSQQIDIKDCERFLSGLNKTNDDNHGQR